MIESEKGSPREQVNRKDKEDANAISFAISKAKPNAISKKAESHAKSNLKRKLLNAERKQEQEDAAQAEAAIEAQRQKKPNHMTNQISNGSC